MQEEKRTENALRPFVIIRFSLSLDPSLDLGESLIKEGPILVPTEILKSEGTGPSGKPLRRAEGLDSVASPTGMEHSLILRACGADPAVDIHSTVRDALTSVAPECDGALSPLLVARDLVKLEEGQYVTKSVLVHSLMRC